MESGQVCANNCIGCLKTTREQQKKPVLVIYATREGHSHTIGEHLALSGAAKGQVVEVVDDAQLPSDFTLAPYASAIVVASVHRGWHEPEITDFVKAHRADLQRIPTAFLSVSLSEAGVENATASAGQRAAAKEDVERMIRTFVEDTGWKPNEVKAVAGALLYTKYNFLVRLVMRRIARQAGGDTDTSRDYVYTNWTSLEKFMNQWLAGTPQSSDQTLVSFQVSRA